MRRLVWSALALAASCTNIPSVAPTPVVLAVFDPQNQDLPTPNDLALANGVVSITPAPSVAPAEAELERSLNGRNGFSVGSAPRVRFTGGVSAASFSPTTVFAFDLGPGGTGTPTALTLDLQYADCNHSLTLASPQGYAQGHTYLFAVRGGVNGLKGGNGERVEPSPAFYFLRAGQDLRQHPDAFPGATPGDRLAAATALEAVRQKDEPFFQLLESQGLPRREVAALWTFSAQTSGEVWFDPHSQQIPMPNDLLKDPTTGLISLPVSPTDSVDANKNLKLGLSRLDGFSTTGALSLSTTSPIDRATALAGQTVRLFRRDTLDEVTDFTATVSNDLRTLTLQPNAPLLPATPYVVVVAGVKDTQANALSAMPLGTLLALAHPLVAADGSSNVSALCAGQAAQLEPVRAAMAPVLDRAESLGVPRASMGAAFTFTTQDLVKRAQTLYQAPYKAQLPLAVANVTSTSPTSVGLLTMPNVAQIIMGSMTTLDFLDPTTRQFRDDGLGTPRQVQFALTLPGGLAQGASVPVVVFGQGLTTERRLGLFVAERLARDGYAMMAIDFPLHGERTPCTKNLDCSLGATCAADGSCRGSNGQPADLARSLDSWPGLGPGTPTSSGATWVDLQNLFASRDHFRQAMVDLSAQTRLIRNMDWRPVTGGFSLRGSHIFYVGVSLGGIMGGAMSGVDPAYSSMLLSVGGAGIPGIMQDSSLFGPLLLAGLSSKGISPGSPQFDAFVNAAKWVMDEVDPINLGRFARIAPLQYVDPVTGTTQTEAVKRIRLQMAINDTIVPNSATYRLVDAEGISRTTDFVQYLAVHGFLADPADPSYLPSQEDMATFLGGDQ